MYSFGKRKVEWASPVFFLNVVENNFEFDKEKIESLSMMDFMELNFVMVVR